MLDPSLVDVYDVIGGYDSITGKNTGLELVNEIYPRFRLVPGQLLAPKFSEDPAVAAVMETKAGNINGHFRCIALCDMPTMVEDEYNPGEIIEHRYTDVPAWKNINNYVSTRQVNGYPNLILGEQKFFYSTQLAGLICRTDAENAGIPYNSPSNKNLKINGLCYENGEELVMNTEQANFLNGNGIITANNFTAGWVAWGNRTGAYPGNTDVKDAFIPIRRMFDWIGNTIVLTYWNKIDFPLTRRTIGTVVDSINIWLNSLAAREYILGGRIEYLEQDNAVTDLLDGIVKFRVKIAPPPPMKEAHFILEYDPDYLQVLFAG
jgi:phage tail sheath protein FI